MVVCRTQNAGILSSTTSACSRCRGKNPPSIQHHSKFQVLDHRHRKQRGRRKTAEPAGLRLPQGLDGMAGLSESPREARATHRQNFPGTEPGFQ